MAATITKKASTTLGSQHGPSASTDLLFEVVQVTADGVTATIECGGTTPQTEMVRRPLAAFVTGADAAGAISVALTASGVAALISGTVITLDITADGDDFYVLIVGLAA